MRCFECARLRALFRVGAQCSDPGTLVLSFGFVSGFGHSRSMFCLVLGACGLEFARAGALLSMCVVFCVVALSSCFIGCVRSCHAVWHAACVFHERRAFMSCVNTWLMSISLPCPALLSLPAVLFFPYRGVFVAVLFYFLLLKAHPSA